MKKEIEVKARVVNLSEVKAKLEKLGCIFTEPNIQEDVYFIDYDDDYSKFKTNYNFLRIRKVKDEFIFNLKRSQSNELDNIEKETKISDPKQMREALELMGYHEVVQVHKTRTKTKYKEMEFCLDEVRDLGSFIEVEKITEGDGERVQEELFTFLETLGVKREDRVVKGYDTLVYLKSKKS